MEFNAFLHLEKWKFSLINQLKILKKCLKVSPMTLYIMLKVRKYQKEILVSSIIQKINQQQISILASKKWLNKKINKGTLLR